MESYNYIQTADRSRLSKESIACGTHLRFLRGTLVASATVVATGVYPIGGVVANVSVAVMILWVPAAAGLWVGAEPAALGGGIAPEGRGVKGRRRLDHAEGREVPVAPEAPRRLPELAPGIIRRVLYHRPRLIGHHGRGAHDVRMEQPARRTAAQENPAPGDVGRVVPPAGGRVVNPDLLAERVEGIIVGDYPLDESGLGGDNVAR